MRTYCRLTPAWDACIRCLVPSACLLLNLWFVSGATADPQLMTDAELDQVSARGVGDAEEGPVLDLGGILASAAPDGTGALFSFDLGSVFGNGSIDLNGLAPSALTLNGSLSPAVLQVENLILNINICAGCRADVIHQIGLGVPIKITSPPTQ